MQCEPKLIGPRGRLLVAPVSTSKSLSINSRWATLVIALSTSLQVRKPAKLQRSMCTETIPIIFNDRWCNNPPQPLKTADSELSKLAVINKNMTTIREKRRIYMGSLLKPLDCHASSLKLHELFRDFALELVSKLLGLVREMESYPRWYTSVDFRSAIHILDKTRMWGMELEVAMAGGVPKKALEQILATYESHEERIVA